MSEADPEQFHPELLYTDDGDYSVSTNGLELRIPPELVEYADVHGGIELSELITRAGSNAVFDTELDRDMVVDVSILPADDDLEAGDE